MKNMSQGLKPLSFIGGRMSGLKPGPISEAKARRSEAEATLLELEAGLSEERARRR
jgi:hypothetical protein